jgi:16S rRNA (uracil1498-N3)-methyltransferase
MVMDKILMIRKESVMPHSFFFEENLPDNKQFILSEDTSRHIAQVLRMKNGDEISITNGQGKILSAEIVNTDKKKTEIKVLGEQLISPAEPNIAIAISLIKNNNRFEWFIEKVTEIGVSVIIPMICKRTEKNHFRGERIKSIAISAMLQSGQAWLPQISSPVSIDEIIKDKRYSQKFIAHCIKKEKKDLTDVVDKKSSRIILIGPEGDFTEEEVRGAIQQNFIPITLGDTRLRTETAGLVAAVLLK